MNLKDLLINVVTQSVNERTIIRLIGRLPVVVLETILNINLSDNTLNHIIDIIQYKKQQK